MFGALYKKELRLLLENGRFQVFAIVAVLLSALILHVRTQNYAEDLSNYRTVIATQERRLQENFNLNWAEYFVYKPPSPFSPVSGGLPWEGHYDGVTYTVASNEDPFDELFFRFDLVWVVGVVMSLSALLLSHDAISGERENGTLRLVYSYPVSRLGVLLSKWLAGVTVLTIVLVIILLVAVLHLTVVAGAGPTGVTIATWLLLLLLSILYVSLFYLFGIAVSAICETSGTSLWILLAGWVVLLFLLPNVTPDLVRRFLGTPSQVSFRRERARISNEYRDKWIAAQEPYKAEYRKTHDDTNLRWAIGNPDGPVMQLQAERKNIINKMQEDFSNKIGQEVSASQIVGCISPYACFLFAATDLTDTGLLAQKRFARQATMFYRGFNEWYLARKAEFGKPGSKLDIETPLDTSDVQRFEFDPPSLSDRFTYVVPYVFVLVVYNGLCFELAHVLLRRSLP